MALPVENSGKSEGAPLGVSLDTEGRTKIEVYVESTGPAVYALWGSNDEYAWRLLEEAFLTLENGGRGHEGFDNAYRWVHVGTANLNDNFIEIVASGAP